MSFEDVITIGKLGRPRGLSGEIFVSPFTDFPERFEGMKKILVKGSDGWEEFEVVASKIIGKRPVLKFNRVDSPEEAARLTNRLVGITKDQLVELPEDTYFLFDLVGCEVYDWKNKHRVGVIYEVEQYPANDVYYIMNDRDIKFSVPAVKSFIKEVDIKNKKIVIDLTGIEEEKETG